MLNIYLLTTGGTIEKTYSERSGSVTNEENKLQRYLSRLRLSGTQTFVIPLMNKDSSDMTDEDRGLILGTVRGLLTEAAPIIITHGTDTMVETGIFLKRSLEDVHVPIVLTGAMTPLGFEDGDGLQNLTESLFAVRLLPAGIYIVMHGRAYPIDRVRKDRARSTFVWWDASKNQRLQ
jgi:L-asparaginase